MRLISCGCRIIARLTYTNIYPTFNSNKSRLKAKYSVIIVEVVSLESIVVLRRLRVIKGSLAWTIYLFIAMKLENQLQYKFMVVVNQIVKYKLRLYL